ncbi:ABC transporter permease [Herbidospora mongoliensis]|uniref:ABC transporter permease n=1 Tax=Herbidospora mongoliensis TaxID=688067 RepID=UPI00083191C7|nr:ABC transporter permease [Herbidospora mongoliensis]
MTTWLALELRRKWRVLTVLALLTALTGTVVFTTLAAARRGAGALGRMAAVTLPATAGVLPNRPGFDWSVVRGLPGVEAVGTFSFNSSGNELNPAPDGVWFPPADPAYMRDVERPVVLEGRLFDPGDPAEAVITPEYAVRHDRAVGDVVRLRLTPDGDARADVTIVGVVRSYLFWDPPGSTGGLWTSPALFAAHRDLFAGMPLNGLVRLRDGEAGLPAFQLALRAATGEEIQVWNVAAQLRREQTVTGYQSATLVAFAAAALLAGAVLVGQAAGRVTAGARAELGALRGWLSPRETTGFAVVAPALAVSSGALLAVPAAVALSPLGPIGLAASFEPAPGTAVDAAVLTAGPVVLAVLVLAGVWRVPHRVNPRRSRLVGSTVPVILGVRHGVGPGPGRASLLGAVTGVAGVAAVLTFSSGIAAADVGRFGFTHEITVTVEADSGPVVAPLLADPDVEGLSDVRASVAASGDRSLTLFARTTHGRAPDLVLTQGRAPTGPDEIALGPLSGAYRIGSQVSLTGPAGSARFTVAGIGFVPEAGQNDYGTGGWLTPAGYDRLFRADQYRFVGVRLKPGTTGSGLVTAVGPLGLVEPTPEPAEIRLLHDLRWPPAVVAAFLALLGLGGLTHALSTTARRRELLLARALGLTPGQARLTVLTQATAIAATALLAGLPLGVAAGRIAWRVVSETTPLLYVAPWTWTVLSLVPAAFAGAAVASLYPGRRVARANMAAALRAG